MNASLKELIILFGAENTGEKYRVVERLILILAGAPFRNRAFL